MLSLKDEQSHSLGGSNTAFQRASFSSADNSPIARGFLLAIICDSLSNEDAPREPNDITPPSPGSQGRGDLVRQSACLDAAVPPGPSSCTREEGESEVERRGCFGLHERRTGASQLPSIRRTTHRFQRLDTRASPANEAVAVEGAPHAAALQEVWLPVQGSEWKAEVSGLLQRTRAEASIVTEQPLASGTRLLCFMKHSAAGKYLGRR